MKKQLYIGTQRIKEYNSEVEGQFIELRGESFYKITGFDNLPDFFMTIVSPSDLWMYLSSNGSLSAGRKDRDNALFPYYTVDKIHDYKSKTGHKASVLIEEKDSILIWEPFSEGSDKYYNIERNLYKSIYGNKIIFEEINHDLGLKYAYGWYSSERFGWIKKSKLENIGTRTMNIRILDGLRNVLPAGMNYIFQNEYSNLSDAYKRNELLEESKLGLYTLSSIPVDRAEPSESLRANTVWSASNTKNSQILISDRQFKRFEHALSVETETEIRAHKGAYYLVSEIQLKVEDRLECFFVAELNQDASKVTKLKNFIIDTKDLANVLNEEIEKDSKSLISKVASSDGIQHGAVLNLIARHFSNTMYNIMRGGVYADSYNIDLDDFLKYLQTINIPLYLKYGSHFSGIENIQTYSQLLEASTNLGDPDIERIAYEYLPLGFSRRHGDPSRPWNLFSIELKYEDGSEKLNYQGNWRDIFQNWEALNYSYPAFTIGMITKFLNASTADGYNPYRITREGIDWEAPDPDDPWAYIGYWGDHQIIYLQKLLEQELEFYPGNISNIFNKEIFVFANVPYRIKRFSELLEDPKNTIDFEHNLHAQIEEDVKKIGADAKLLYNKDGNLQRANLTEKLLITLLAKVSNFIPEAGIWLNTQRPEWNDANNALVGSGVSMVTLYYIRRFISFWLVRLKSDLDETKIAEEIRTHLDQTWTVLKKYEANINSVFSDQDRFFITEGLGEAGSNYRTQIYNFGFSGRKDVLSYDSLQEFLELLLKFIDHSISRNKRSDNLYHAYNLISIENNSIGIRHLYEMLEGQVAILSSGYLNAKETVKLLDELRNSSIYREDQNSYLLYPDRDLPGFTEKNIIPSESVKNSKLLTQLLKDGNESILIKDQEGKCHFNASFRNAFMLEEALEELNESIYTDFLKEDKQIILDLYEQVFDHQSFTGRSGTFFGYEGLGSIYWHMVSKLLLAVQENYFSAIKEKEDESIIEQLATHYFEIKDGIGAEKSPEEYGAFPMDAYSHTPANAGVKQPGLTGQVKEDVISRLHELGIHIQNGMIEIDISLLNKDEILKNESQFRYFDLEHKEQVLKLASGSLAFTFCQVPFIYNFNSTPDTKIIFENGDARNLGSHSITNDISEKIFNRTGEVIRVECSFRE